MSKLIDKLNRISQPAAPSIGFRKAQTDSSKPRLSLIAMLKDAAAENPADYAAGADGVLMHTSQEPTARTIQKVSRAISDIPCGWWLENSSQKKIEQMVKAGCDFIAFPSSSAPMPVSQNDKSGKILQVEASISDGLLRTINDLPVDAVMVGGLHEKEMSLTWNHLMLFRRFASLLNKPLLVSIPSDMTTDALQALCDSGVDGVIAEVKEGQSAERLKELRQMIEKLMPPSLHKGKKHEAILPGISRKPETVAEDTEEEEDE